MQSNNWKLEDAYSCLENDPVLNGVISITGKLNHLQQKDLYSSLLSSVISQQLSTKAAATIWTRFMELLMHNPEPQQIITLTAEKLRSVGISSQKAGYLKAIADFALEGKLESTKINHFHDDELVDYLTKIKGVGRWTAEMILIFSLNRPDVLPVHDLGVRQSILMLYGLEDHGKETDAGLRDLSKQWQPYRSLVSRHLWRLRDTNP